MSFQIERKEPKVLSEKEYRSKILSMAKYFGCEQDVLQVFKKYDNLLKNCHNEKEKKAIGYMGVIEISKILDNGYLGIGGQLTVDGQVAVETKPTEDQVRQELERRANENKNVK